MQNVKVVTFEVPSLWGTGVRTPEQASSRVLAQMRKHDLRGGFWTIALLPRPLRDTRPGEIAVSLIGDDRPREVGRSVTVALRVDSPTDEQAIEDAYAQLREPSRGPWAFVVKYAGQSHAVAIPVTVGAPVPATQEPALAA